MKCMKEGCEVELDSPLAIEVKYPICFKGNILYYYLCRTHFLEADKMDSEQFRKWVHKMEVT
jgi:hypothetical protein